MRSFFHASSNWELFAPMLQKRVEAISRGKARLELAAPSEVPGGLMGMAMYFKLTRETDAGPEVRIVALAQR